MGVNAIPTKNALQSTLSSTLSSAEVTSYAIADDWSTFLADVSASRPIVVCVDRIDSNGLATPSKREYIQAESVTGGSGTTFTTLTRAMGESTQQAHSAGAIVELVLDVDTVKSITDGFLVGHNADGTHNVSGTLAIAGTASTSAEVRLAEDTDNGTNYIGLKAPASVGTSKTFVLPDADGSANQVLKTDGSATLKWGSVDSKSVIIQVVNATAFLSTGDGKAYFTVPEELNGMNLTAVHARVITAGTTNTTDIQIANVTDAVDMLSTKLTINSTETGSDTGTPAVIDTTKDDVVTNDLLRIDIDAVSTTAPKGLIVRLRFALP